MGISKSHGGATPPHEELADLIWSGAIPQAPGSLVNGVEDLYLVLKHYYLDRDELNRDEWLACIQAAPLALDPCQQKSIRMRLTALYLSASGNSISNQECEKFAEAWIHAAEARRAVAEGHGDAVQAHINSAYSLLTENLKSQGRRRLFENRAKAWQECIEAFAKLVQVKRPVGGWTDHSHVAKALAQMLKNIMDQAEQKYGPLGNREAAALIIAWLGKGKGPVYEAYRGRGS